MSEEILSITGGNMYSKNSPGMGTGCEGGQEP